MTAAVSANPGSAHEVLRQSVPGTAVIAAMVAGTAATMISGVQPALFAALSETNRVTTVDVGHLATVEILALALASALGPWFHLQGSMRLKALALSSLLACVDVFCCEVASVHALLLLRCFAGLMEGVLLGVMVVTTTAGRNPDRLYGLFWGISALPMALAAYLLPLWVVPRLGANGVFITLALVAAASAVAAGFLVDVAPPPPAVTGTARSRWNLPILMCFAVIALQNAANGGAWSYLQLLADQRHFAPEIAELAVSVGLLAQIAGSVIASTACGQLPFRAVLIVQSALSAGLLACLAFAQAPALYLGLALGWNFLFLAQLPLQVRLLIAFDESRRSVRLQTFVALVGVSIGPSISALGVGGMQVTGAFWISASMMTAALCGYAWLRAPR